eukprot:5828232-Pyramimonas_sp.AAC.1
MSRNLTCVYSNARRRTLATNIGVNVTGRLTCNSITGACRFGYLTSNNLRVISEQYMVPPHHELDNPSRWSACMCVRKYTPAVKSHHSDGPRAEVSKELGHI